MQTVEKGFSYSWKTENTQMNHSTNTNKEGKKYSVPVIPQQLVTSLFSLITFNDTEV